MKTKTLERQCRDLGELITQLQDTHSEIKVAIIKGDLGTESMHAHELADDMACFAKDDAIQMAQAIGSYQDDDEEKGDAPSESTPADEGIAASKADAHYAQIVQDTNKLAEKVATLRSAWNATGYNKDDGVRDDLLIHALGIAGRLAYPNSNLYADDPSMRQLANDAERLSRNLSDIADDLEAEFEG